MAHYGHSLLLRLFESEHFSLPLALSYLKQYPDEIGITYYLVQRLEQFDLKAGDIEFYWPQLCHLLVSRPSDSAALENFIIRKCNESTHLAMLSLWYLQASLSDLASQPKSKAFATCRRAYNRVQGIIFGDLSDPHSASSPTALTLGIKEKEKVNPHAAPVWAGIGLLAAGIAQPALASSLGTIVLEQGRRKASDLELALLQASADNSEDEDTPPTPVASSSRISSPPTNASKFSKTPLQLKPSTTRPDPGSSSPPISRSATFISQNVLRGKPDRKQKPALPHPGGKTRPPLLGQGMYRATSVNVNSLSHTNLSSSASASVPSLPLRSQSGSTLAFFPQLEGGSVMDVQKAAASIPKQVLTRYLRSHACRAQLDLLTSLQDISTRLVSVPKMARVSALRAELTVLNHGLPTGCCLCVDCDGLVPTEGSTSDAPFRGHHRIVRISPSEAVVLNSADRAPFLIHVEVLEGDLDFDPSRRQNAEDLRAVLSDRKLVGSRSIDNASPSFAQRTHQTRPSEPGASPPLMFATDPGDASSPRLPTSLTKINNELLQDGDITELVKTPEPGPPSPAPPDEEMDMVEQLYGDLALGAPVPDVDAYAPTIHNRSLDEEAWRRQQSALPDRKKVLTLDEYADRMRMAAVMLSQLAANEQTPMSMIQATSGAAGGLVGVGMGITYGIGGAVAESLGAVRDRWYGTGNKTQGQASAGTSARLNTSHASSGISAVQGTSPSLMLSASTSGGSGHPPASPSTTTHRARVLLPSEATAIKDRIMAEMMTLEEERMARMQADSKLRNSGWTASGPLQATQLEDQGLVMSVVHKEDPSGASFAESWTEKRARIRASSPYGHLASWKVLSVIVKTGADLRQEQLATQLIREFGRIWSETNCPHWIRYFRILVTSESTGLIETIVDTLSVHSIKKAAYAKAAASSTAPLNSYSLYDHFIEKFGEPTSSPFRKAQDCFMKSLASYSIICYLLQIKDRHNGNILVDKSGHIIHIDFGFLLSNSPGQLGFEMAPFKMTQDYIDILGGLESERYAEFRSLLKRCFWDVRQHADRIIMVVELMQKESRLPCFAVGDQTAQQLRERFQLGLTRKQCDEFVDKLLDSAALSSFTRLYDAFQTFSQGIL